MGLAEWLYDHGAWWVWVFLAACTVLVGLMLLVPWHAFRGFRRPLEDRDRWVGIRRHGARWARRRATRDTVGGKHRTPQGGQSTWQYIDSGAWAVVDTGRAQAPEITEDTKVLTARRLTPSDTEEAEAHARTRSARAA